MGGVIDREMMERFFSAKKLQAVRSSENKMAGFWGQMADKLPRRLEELASAGSPAEIPHLPPFRCHALKGNRSGQFSVDLVHHIA